MVCCITAGNGVVCSGEMTYHLSKGDIFIDFPNSNICYESDARNPWSYYWITFNGTSVHRLFNSTGLSPERPVLHSVDDVLCDLMSNIYRVKDKSSAADAAMTGYLYIFFSELISRTGEAQKKNAMQDYLVRAVEYIRENYVTDLRVEEIASKVGVSRSQLYRAFMQEFGMSPHQYLKHYRINEACTLLRNRELSVGAVAAAVGFTDSLYFSRVFREVKGVSPSQYQQKHKT